MQRSIRGAVRTFNGLLLPIRAQRQKLPDDGYWIRDAGRKDEERPSASIIAAGRRSHKSWMRALLPISPPALDVQSFHQASSIEDRVSASSIQYLKPLNR
jgi:hypothetical protein